MHTLVLLGRNAALAAFAKFISGRRSMITGKVSATAGNILIPALGTLGSIVASMPREEVTRLFSLAGGLLQRYLPFIRGDRNINELAEAGLPEYLADAVHFSRVGGFFGKHERKVRAGEQILSPILSMTPWTAPFAGLLRVGTEVAYGPTPIGPPSPGASPPTQASPLRTLFGDNVPSFDVIMYRRKSKGKKRAQAAAAAAQAQLGALQRRIKEEETQAEHEAQLEQQRQQSEEALAQQQRQREEVESIYKGQEEARRAEAAAAKEAAASAEATELERAKLEMQKELLQQQAAQSALLQQVMTGLAGNDPEEESDDIAAGLSPDMRTEWYADGEYMSPGSYLEMIGAGTSNYPRQTFWDNFTEYQSAATAYGWPSPDQLLADVLINTVPFVDDREEVLFDCQGCKHDCSGCQSDVAFDNAFRQDNAMPSGTFFKSSWITARLADMPDGTFGMVNTSHKPFQITINRNVQYPRAAVSLAHECMHVLSELLKLGLTHDQIHHTAVMLVSEVLPALNALGALRTEQASVVESYA